MQSILQKSFGSTKCNNIPLQNNAREEVSFKGSISPSKLLTWTTWGGVDKKDGGSADYATSIRTNHFQMYEFFWLFNTQLHASFPIAVALSYIYPSFEHDKSKDEGSQQFQIDLAMLLYEILLCN